MEADVITASQQPATVRSLVADLAALGVEAGSTVIVHSAMSKLGWVAGGAHAVVLALLQAIGRDGTLVMPTHTGLTDPQQWENPPVPETWWEVIRSETPAYDPLLTPTRGMGAIVECFRNVPGVMRSPHPTYSAAAVGPNAGAITATHPIDDGLGERSPYARLYDLDAHVLLLGVDHGNNTSLHLAEHRATYDKCIKEQGAPVIVDGEHRWVSYRDLDGDSEDFPALGEDFAKETGAEARGSVGAGEARLMRQRPLVDYAVGWMERNRPQSVERS